MKMRVLKPFSYSGRRLRAGDEVDMRESFARTMERMGKAEAAKPPAPAPEAKPKGRYRRRDMVAEEAQPAAPPAPPPSEPAPDPESTPVDLPPLPKSED